MNHKGIRKSQKDKIKERIEKRNSEPDFMAQKIINLLAIKQQEVTKQLRHFSSYEDQRKLQRLQDSLARSIDDVRRAMN